MSALTSLFMLVRCNNGAELCCCCIVVTTTSATVTSTVSYSARPSERNVEQSQPHTSLPQSPTFISIVNRCESGICCCLAVDPVSAAQAAVIVVLDVELLPSRRSLGSCSRMQVSMSHTTTCNHVPDNSVPSWQSHGLLLLVCRLY